MEKFRYIGWAVLSILILLFANPVVSEARSYTIDEAEINAFIKPNGNVYIEEMFTYTFDGEYNGTTRAIGDDKFSGVKFFDGYEAPSDMTFDNFDQNELKPLLVEREDYTFNIHNKAENETKKMVYSYELKEAARKYKDVGEFYWRFFDSMNESDIHNLKIQIYLHDADKKKTLPLSEDTKGFIHDQHDGTFELDTYGLIYENELLPAYKWSEQRLIFPPEFLRDMELTENVKKRDAILKEEAKRDAKKDRFENNLFAINMSDFIFFMLSGFLLLYAIFYPKRIIRLFKQGDAALANAADSLTLVALQRGLRLRYTDINAALFTMQQEGHLKIKYVMEKEKPNFIYVLTTPVNYLKEHEQFLANWLFTKEVDGCPAFKLNQIPINDPKAEQMEQYKQKNAFRDFKKNFKRWQKIMRKDPDIKAIIKPVFLRKIFYAGIVPFWMIWGALHLFFSIQDHINYYGLLPLAAPVLVMAVAGLRIERIWTTILLIALLILSQVLDMSPDFALFYVAHINLILISLFLPAIYPTIDGLAYKKGMNAWDNALKKATLPIDKHQPAELEKAFQHAISLEAEVAFCHHYLPDITAVEAREAYPLLIAPEETKELYHLIHTARFTFYHNSSSSGGGGSTSSGSGGSSGGGGAGAF